MMASKYDNAKIALRTLVASQAAQSLSLLPPVHVQHRKLHVQAAGHAPGRLQGGCRAPL
jgi:hypothetical protein